MAADDKNRFTKMLGKLRVDLMKQYNALSEACEHGINMVHQGMIALGGHVNNHWGAFNGLVRVFEGVGIKQGWWKDRSEFQALYITAVKEVAEEARAWQEKELARIRQEQRDKKEPTAVRPLDNPATAAAEQHKQELPFLRGEMSDAPEDTH